MVIRFSAPSVGPRIVVHNTRHADDGRAFIAVTRNGDDTDHWEPVYIEWRNAVDYVDDVRAAIERARSLGGAAADVVQVNHRRIYDLLTEEA